MHRLRPMLPVRPERGSRRLAVERRLARGVRALVVLATVVAGGCGDAPPPATSAPAASSAVAPPPAAVSPGAAPSSASCDELAAHPEDPGKTAAGIADDDLMPMAAIAACEAAVTSTPDNPRLLFQLGRAYWADDEVDDAMAAFLESERLGYAPAYFYLALAYQQGLVIDEAPDAAAADEMFLLAASAGFPPAVSAYESGER
jgi:TPR repeat protein